MKYQKISMFYLGLLAIQFLSCKPAAKSNVLDIGANGDIGTAPNLDSMLQKAANGFQSGQFAEPMDHPETHFNNMQQMLDGWPQLAGESSEDFSNYALNPNFQSELSDKVSLGSYVFPAQNQGKEGACTAFAMTAAIETKLLIDKKNRSKLSEAHFWRQYSKPSFELAKGAAEMTLVMEQKHWPWDAQAPTNYRYPFVAGAVRSSVVSMNQIHQRLAQNQPVFIGISVNKALQKVGQDGWVRLGNPEDSKFGGSGHALMVFASVRFQQPINGSKGFWAFKNSWGPTWGDQGFGYLPYEYCELPGAECVALAIESVDTGTLLEKTDFKNIVKEVSGTKPSKKYSCFALPNGPRNFETREPYCEVSLNADPNVRFTERMKSNCSGDWCDMRGERLVLENPRIAIAVLPSNNNLPPNSGNAGTRQYLIGLDLVPATAAGYQCLQIKLIAAGSIGEREGFRVGDCIIDINNLPVRTLAEYDESIAALKAAQDQDANFHVIRDFLKLLAVVHFYK